MKSSLFKNICLLLVWASSMPMLAKSYIHNEVQAIQRIGLAGGATYHLTPSNNFADSRWGGGGMLTYDCTYYKALDALEIGLKTGVDVGYLYTQNDMHFEDQFNNIDYLGNTIEYTTSGHIDVVRQQLHATVPLMFAMRKQGFIWNLGVRLQATVYANIAQHLSEPMIQAHYPAYNVTIFNELITGVVDDNQLHMSTELLSPTIALFASTEIGYEYQINRKNSIGAIAYFDVGFWDMLSKSENGPIISVDPISNSDNPVPIVQVHAAYPWVSEADIPLQFGVKIFYSFNLGKK